MTRLLATMALGAALASVAFGTTGRAQAPAEGFVYRERLYMDSGLTRPVGPHVLVIAYSSRRIRVQDVLDWDATDEQGFFELRIPALTDRRLVWLLESDLKCRRNFHPGTSPRPHVMHRLADCREAAADPRTLGAVASLASHLRVKRELGNEEAADMLERLLPVLANASAERLVAFEPQLPPAREHWWRATVEEAAAD